MITFRGRNIIYLDNAATSLPKPPEVVEAVSETLLRSGNPGRSGHTLSYESMRDIFEVREAISKLFNIDDSKRVILTSNATVALNIAIKGFLKKNDHVITTVMEHNSVLRPISSVAGLGVEVTYVEANPRGAVHPQDILRSIRNNTKMVIMIHGSNVTGAINDISTVGDVCREKEIVFLVDASQTAGVVDIDVRSMNIDLLAASGHKALFGPQGTGFLYVGEGVDINPLIEGGTGSRSEKDMQPSFLPDKLEAGTFNTPGLAGLRRGVEFVMQRGVDRIYSHEKELVEMFHEALLRLERARIYGPELTEERLGVVLMNIDGIDPGELSMCLDENYGVLVRSGLHCAPLAHRALGTFPEGGVRVSFSAMNTVWEVEKTVEAIIEICKKY